MKKAEKKKMSSTRDFMGIEDITHHSIKTAFGELVYFLVKPTNISVLSDSSIASRIYALMTVLKGFSDIGMLCLNSRENFEENKRHLQARLKDEPVPAIRKLLEQDLTYLDRIQVQMATAREFVIVVQLRGEKDAEAMTYLARIEKSLKDQGFTVKKADEQDIKRLLGVYFEQNVTTERFEDFDGERWVIMGE